MNEAGNVESLTLRKKLLWISIFYFAQGMPFGVVIDVLPVYFRQHGVSLTEIGVQMCVSVKTISTHRSRMLQKLGLRTNADLVRYVIQNRLVP